MKIKPPQSRFRKLLVPLSVLVLVAAVGYGVYAANSHTWPFADSSQSSSKEQRLKNTSANEKYNNTSGSDKKSGKSPSSSTVHNKDYIDTPITNPPTDTSTYPIENAHYKISQKSQTSYHITLYPIVNSPAQSDYNAQLKAYKEEALDYLTGRYGSIDSFAIKWSPANAKNL